MYNFFISLSIIFSMVFSATLSGTINYAGKSKKPKTLSMDADPICGSSHKDKVFAESFITKGDNNNLKNVFVWLEGVEYNGETIKDPAVIDQVGCIYKPHVQGVMKGQEVIIKNSDATLHNIHSMAKVNNQFNFAMPKVVKSKTTTFDKVEDPFYIKCDVHPWMKTWVGVFDHPFFAVTDENGNYKIENIPPGTYKVVFWQEKLSNLSKKFIKVSNSVSIEISDDKHTLDYTFQKPEKKKK